MQPKHSQPAAVIILSMCRLSVWGKSALYLLISFYNIVSIKAHFELK